MRVLLDTHIILDFVLERSPFFNNAKLLLTQAENSEIEAIMTATTVTDIYYISAKIKGGRSPESF